MGHSYMVQQIVCPDNYRGRNGREQKRLGISVEAFHIIELEYNLLFWGSTRPTAFGHRTAMVKAGNHQ